MTEIKKQDLTRGPRWPYIAHLTTRQVSSQFLPFKVDCLSEGICCTGKQTGSHNNVSLVKNGRNSTKVTKSPLSKVDSQDQEISKAQTSQHIYAF